MKNDSSLKSNKKISSWFGTLKKPKPQAKPLGQKGQSLVEYLIIVAIVGVGAISIMRMVGQSLKVQFAHVAMALGAKVEGGGKIDELNITKSSYQKNDLTNFWHSSLDKNSNGNQDSGNVPPNLNGDI